MRPHPLPQQRLGGVVCRLASLGVTSHLPVGLRWLSRTRCFRVMPRNAQVTLRFGPYEACGFVGHRKHRLQGLKAVLLTDGHEVVLEEIPDWNVVELIVNGENVFQCNIKALDFGGDGLLDPLCKEARIAVLNAY
ncbi:UPF0728 protein C10orf53 homolog isoform X1 [Rhinatrema bivittatum]|uniref:UPF0728 protein C10orf53 homolog isoform X1 n=1 Tax=Rhinatrema bivittatum TaxID=194408 RepID=UPI0011288261|nr:UPF0728 protein C10orf53 homolog isoform X1 [Rhinatrema bivittatum]